MAAAVFLLMLPVSCGTAASTTYSYNGPGSHYAISIGNGTFTLSKAATSAATADWTATGSYTTSLGYRFLTISSVTGSGGPTAGDKGYVLEVPGIGSFLKPFGSGPVIPMVSSGSCPTGDFTGNWIITNAGSDTPDDANDSFFGAYAFTFATGANSVQPDYRLTNFTARNGASAGAATCTNGVVTFVGGATGYMTPSGAAIINGGGQNIMAFPSGSFSVAGLAGDYSSLVFDGGSNAVSPVSVTISGSAGTAYDLTESNISAGTVPGTSSATFTISAANTPGTGFFTSVVTIAAQTGNMACTVLNNTAVTTTKVILCAGQQPSDNSKLYNLLMVSR